MKYLIVGLGNIGDDYNYTRHNIGFLVVDCIAASLGVSFKSDRLGYLALANFKGRSIYLLKPNVYMNNSGKSVLYWLKSLKIKDSNYLIVTDDIFLPFSKIRFRVSGSNSGHNGLRSVEECLRTSDYPRLKMGIGNNFTKGNQARFVLSKFNNEELLELPSYLQKAADAALCFCTFGVSQAMNKYN